MWVTKALNGDREEAQLFLAFGRGQEQAGIPARSPIARRMRGREAGTWAGRRGLYCVSRGLSAPERSVDSLL